jgi:beta-glucosidase
MRLSLPARLTSLLTLSLACTAALAQTQRPLPYLDPSLPKAERAADIVGRLTLDEKVSEMMNSSAAIPRLGIPAYDWWNEGLHGVARSGYATLFPQAIGMAATWDAPLLKREGDVISTEARAKNNDALAHGNHSIYFGLTFWSPNINIFRDPRWGRGQETLGEDPFLTARLGVNFVEGLQGTNPDFYKVIATPKHFAVHSGPESERHRFDVDPSPHDLWETYLPAFRATITEGKADSLMCAYNAIEGKPACGSDLLLQTILRGYWNFQGFVTSDCGAVTNFFEKTGHHTSPDREHADAVALHAGTDTECGDSYKGLGDAVHQGLISEADIDVSLRRLFLARMQLGLFDDPKLAAQVGAKPNPYAAIPMSEVDSPAHRATALEAADKSMVLLKNDGILPLAATKYKTIAVIGPNAASLAALEGNYNAIARNPQMPVDALHAAFPGARLIYAQGSGYAEGVPVPAPRSLFHPTAGSTEAGLKAEYFASDSFDGSPVVTRVDPAIDFDWDHGNPVPGTQQDVFAVRWTGTLTPPKPGAYEFAFRLFDCYPCNDAEHLTVQLDGKTVSTSASDEASEGRSSATPHFTLTATDTQPHTFTVLYRHKAPIFGGGLTLDWYPPNNVLRAEAVATAQKADLVVAMVGLSPNLEGEEMPVHVEGFDGGDRTDISLPAPQRQMLEAVAATGKPLVVVLLNGSALAVDWAQEHANAILEAWYPGEAGGRAIADTLTGANNPGGRLPVTFYRSVGDLPPFNDYSMKGRTYRYATSVPLYGFGYGLSFTHFAYSHLKLSAATLHAGDTLTVEADVKNTGTRAGDEVAEVYLVPPPAGNGGLSPHLSLEGFERLHLAPGQVKHVTFKLDPRELAQVDAQGVHVVMPGSYSVSLGGAQPKEANAPTPALTSGFSIEGTQQLPH